MNKLIIKTDWLIQISLFVCNRCATSQLLINEKFKQTPQIILHFISPFTDVSTIYRAFWIKKFLVFFFTPTRIFTLRHIMN